MLKITIDTTDATAEELATLEELTIKDKELLIIQYLVNRRNKNLLINPRYAKIQPISQVAINIFMMSAGIVVLTIALANFTSFSIINLMVTSMVASFVIFYFYNKANNVLLLFVLNLVKNENEKE